MKITSLTKLQRHTAYIILLEEALDKNEFGTGLCSLIADTLHLNDNGGYVEDSCGMTHFDVIENFFPELAAKEPERPFWQVYWFICDFGGWQKRIDLLEQCIEETI
jgi:hypothetical protein